MNKNKSRISAYFSLVVTFLVIVFEVYGFVILFPEEKMHMFIYYTICSNFLLLIISIFWVIALINFIRDGVAISKTVYLMKYIAVCTVTQTFIVVATILVPFGHFSIYDSFLSGANLFFHLIGPVLGLVCFLLFDKGPNLSVRDQFLALSPTLLYAAISITLNILKIWHGPYPFLYVYEQSILMSIIWFIVVVGGALLIATLIRLIRNHRNREFVF